MAQVQQLLIKTGEKEGKQVVTDVAVTKPTVPDKAATVIDVGQAATINTLALERYASALEAANDAARQAQQLELMQQLPELDANHDGTVTFEEMQAAIQKSPLFKKFLATQPNPEAAMIAVMEMQEKVFGATPPLLHRARILQAGSEDNQDDEQIIQTSGPGLRNTVTHLAKRFINSLIDD